MTENPFSSSNFWLLRIVLPGRWGRWITGSIIFAVLFCFFAYFGQISSDEGTEMSTGAVLFFCIILAYIVPIHHMIVERSLLAMSQLTSAFPSGDEMLAGYQERIISKPRNWYTLTLTVGFVAGLTHNTFLADGNIIGALSRPGSILPFAVTMVIWVIMTGVISSLIETAVLFNRLGERVKVDPLNIRALTPFGSVAVSSTLAMIGAQAAFPALMFDSDTHWITFAPGLLATGIPMIFLFLLPVLPIHRRIVVTKRRALDRVNRDINLISGVSEQTDVAQYTALQPLLTYRTEITSAPEWPFDTSVMGRLALYLIIPPLTWIGAALIEILVDSAI